MVGRWSRVAGRLFDDLVFSLRNWPQTKKNYNLARRTKNWWIDEMRSLIFDMFKNVTWFFQNPKSQSHFQKRKNGILRAVHRPILTPFCWPTCFVFVRQRYFSLCRRPISSVVEYSVEQPSISVRPTEDSLWCLSPVDRLLYIWNFLECRPTDTDWKLKIDRGRLVYLAN